MPYLNINYKKIHYADWPPTSNSTSTPRETFILIHGLGSSQNYYTALIPHLTQQNYRCIALDTTGQGRSPYTYVEQSIHSLALDVVDAMDALSIPKAVVVGHSMAGFVVPYLAAAWPDRVAAICLLGPVYPNKGAVPTFEQRIAAVEKDGMQLMADTVPYSAVGSCATSLHHAFIRELLLANQPDGYISMCRVIVGAAEEQNTPDYGKVACPVLIVAGDEDKSAPLEGCRRMLEECGTVEGEKRMEVLEGVGHWMVVEAAEEVGKKMVGFFRAVQ